MDTSINPVHLYASEGAYRIRLKCSNKYCSDTVSHAAIIPKPYPRGASFSHAATSCIGKAIKFENHSDSSMKCHWDFGDSSGSTAYAPIHSYSKKGTYFVRLIVTNPAGCIDTAAMDSIVVNPPPKAILTRKDSVKACKSYTYIFENQSKYADSFRWDAGDGIFVIPGDKSGLLQHTYTKEGTYKLRLAAFTTDCADTETLKLTLKFAPGFPAHILGKVGSTVICRNSGITFKALGGKAFTYQWDLGDGSTDSATTVTHVYVKPGIFSVRLTAYNADSCYFTDSTTVNVLDTFTASVLQDKSKGCSPLEVSFKAGTVQKDVPLHYLWDFGDKQKDTTANPVHIFKSANASTNFRVRLKVSNDYCDDTTSTMVSIQNINPQAASPMRLATVVNNSSIFLTWNSNSAASKYRVYKKGPLDDIFNKLADITDTFYTDTKVDVNTTAYCYKVQPLDECGNEGAISSAACPILLSGHILDKNDSRSELNWNAYRSFLFGTSAENVYKDGKLLSSPVFSPFNDDNFYSADSGVHRYWIEATENGSDFVSRSNIIKLIESVHLWIPDVFTPNQDNLNDGFEISTSGIRQMHTTIYNRWGERMYESDDLHPKWDGHWQGNMVPEGVFFYTVTGLGNDGEHISRKGTVTVLR